MAEEEDISGDDTSQNWMLGFLEKGKNLMFDDPDIENWDGGKVGGLPVAVYPNNYNCIVFANFC